MTMSNDFTVVDDDDNEFQELLDGIELSSVTPGKRGGGRKATNNTGADVLGIKMLNELRTNHRVNLFQPGNLKGNTLWGVVDTNSYNLAIQISQGIEPSYRQQGILAVSLSKSDDDTMFLQWWKATVINNVLSFRKVFKSGEQYHLTQNAQGKWGLWKIDNSTGSPMKKDNGDYVSFPYSTLVNFEEYLNAIVMVTEVPVSFPEGEVSKLQGLTEILANVNLNGVSEPIINEDDSTDDVEDDEFEEVE